MHLSSLDKFRALSSNSELVSASSGFIARSEFDVLIIHRLSNRNINKKIFFYSFDFHIELFKKFKISFLIFLSIGPACLNFITPCLSKTNVSGIP